MFVSLLRFWCFGWIEKFYITPKFHFTYYGFEWIKPIGQYTYGLFVISMIASLLVMIGYRYKWAILIFFLSFTYIELMDKATYLNHYYFISVLSFLLIFLPANSYFSFDAYRNVKLRYEFVPQWTIDVIKMLLGIVYLYAGLAKLNSDWIIHALPLKLWLTSSYGVPVIGAMLKESWVHYAFSWGGAVYDLTIPFLLYFDKTRSWAFAFVVLFHILTRMLFPIGMFPFIMIIATLIFFNSTFHRSLLRRLSLLLKLDISLFNNQKSWAETSVHWKNLRMTIVSIFLAIQLLVPFRYLLYPGNLFWAEQGYRFSWRVMLMEKTGSVNFKIVDGQSKKRFFVQNNDFLNSFQEKQMSTQPDMILEYAHLLEKHFKSQGHQNIEIYVDSYAALNGRASRRFIDPEVDLTKINNSLKHKDWILPAHDE